MTSWKLWLPKINLLEKSLTEKLKFHTTSDKSNNTLVVSNEYLTGINNTADKPPAMIEAIENVINTLDDLKNLVSSLNKTQKRKYITEKIQSM